MGVGEQSHKMLRAERMSDCIFNGTAKRPPMGMSEVTLTLVDPKLSEATLKLAAAPEALDEADSTAAETDAESQATVIVDPTTHVAAR